MTERIYVSRNTFFVAGVAAVLTFLALLWIGKTRDRAQTHEQESVSPEKRVTLASTTTKPVTTQPKPASLPVLDHWSPPPTEFVRLVTQVSLHNARGKEVKQFEVGKRLRVTKRDGDKITINYLGTDYTIPTASTEPSR
jgi:hypothetical protein